MNKKLVLFDIDGTIMKGNIVHRQSYSEGIRGVYGIQANVDEIQSKGMTDKQIIIELLRKKGVTDEKINSTNLNRVFNVMVGYCKKNISSDSSLKIIPNVKELIVKLEKRGHILGLLTGNLEEIAKLKMQKLGLSNFFKFGGFGEFSEVRSDLVKEATARAKRKYEIDFEKKDIFIIGDTPLDIKCGKDAGVNTIIVATGDYSVEELKEHNPDYLFKDFSNTDIITKSIENV